MKVSRMKRHVRRDLFKQAELGDGFIVDEFHMIASPVTAAMPRCYLPSGAGSLLVTQAIVRGKGGKRVFVGSVRDAAGQPFPPQPKKFLPAQVLRRQAR